MSQEAKDLEHARHQLHLVDRNLIDHLNLVTDLTPSERLAHGCRDYEKWVKARLAVANKERERIIQAWEKSRPG